MKRVFDLVVASVGLVVLAPVLVLTALAVALDSGLPVFYRGVRTGKGGIPFRIFKFRTMRVDAEQVGGGSTGKNDPRITRVGRVLRRHKLDELPQLLNVIRGEMSLVGPRPELPAYTALYAGEELSILSVRPGITDLASIEFVHLGDVLGDEDPDRKYEEEVRPVKNALRVRYVKEQSFLGDLRLLFRTIARIASSP
jgi:lipopolysaccharide/colanic/teichoic acid biosynthesis glycosyltransferase